MSGTPRDTQRPPHPPSPHPTAQRVPTAQPRGGWTKAGAVESALIACSLPFSFIPRWPLTHTPALAGDPGMGQLCVCLIPSGEWGGLSHFQGLHHEGSRRGTVMLATAQR